MKKKKIASLAAVGALAVVVLLSGTYAWQSISQRAKNEVRDVRNPGARLHDDFDFSDNGNKDVYVENYTKAGDGSNEEKGVEIYARIRLDEYMELGQGAGITGRSDTGIQVLKDANASNTPDLDNVSTWTTYLWEREKKMEAAGASAPAISDETSVFRKYVLWNQDPSTPGKYKTDGQTYYMPTFDKNKDSDEADINGTLEGDGVTPYADHHTYAANEKKTDFAIYDADDNTINELKEKAVTGVTRETILAELTTGNPKDWDTSKLLPGGSTFNSITVASQNLKVQVNPDTAGTAVESVEVDTDGDGELDILIRKEEHTAAQTLANGEIISMEKWMETTANGGKNGEPGNYWVFDEDGWVYWANPLQPEAVTSLLLDKIEIRTGADITTEYYYAINVVAQFASKADWGTGTTTTVTTDASGNVTSITKGTGTHFYDGASGGITANGEALLNKIAGIDNSAVTPAVKYNVTFTCEAGAEGTASVPQGGQTTFSVALTEKDGGTSVTPVNAVEWTLADASAGKAALASGTKLEVNQSDSSQATLKVASDETATKLKVTASYKDNDGKTGTNSFTVNVTEVTEHAKVTEIKGKTALAADATEVKDENKVTIDGIDWWILYKDSEKALLLSAEMIDFDGTATYKWTDTFGATNSWQNSYIREYLNETGTYTSKKTAGKTFDGFLKKYPTVAEIAKETTYKTRTQVDVTTWYDTTDKVFLLSEADLFGTFGGVYSNGNYTGVVATNDYTLQNDTRLLTNANLLKRTGGDNWYWLRSPRYNTNYVAGVTADGTAYVTHYDSANGGLRPAFFVNLSSN